MPKGKTLGEALQTVSVKCECRVLGQSVSFTVYGGRLGDVANEAQRRLGSRWQTTDLNDRRHSRNRRH